MSNFNAVGEEFLGNFFGHYGVKGMRWGVRRTDAELARSRKKKGGEEKTEKKVVGKTKTSGKKASELSDAQLQKVINRMNMEQQYSRLTAQPPGKLAAAQKFLSDIALSVAKTQMTAVGNAYAGEFVSKNLMPKKK